MVDYEIGSMITATASAIAGEGESITLYRWSLDAIVQTETSNIFSFSSENLALGGHNIRLMVQNSCGEFSPVVVEYFNLVYTCPLPTVSFVLS